MASNGVHPPSTPPRNDMSDSSSKYPRPKFYVVRPDMTFVPMIPADELPPMIRVKGVPTSLTLSMITDWDMARVSDKTDRSDMNYEVELCTSSDAQQNGSYVESAPSVESSSNLGRGDACIAEASMSEDKVQYPKPEVIDGPSWRGVPASKEQTQDAIDNIVEAHKWEKNNHPSRTKNAATPGFFGKKKYCTYWLRNHSCDYMQEGCKYVHAIPDSETRRAIGFHEDPKWIKEELASLQRAQDREQEHFLTTGHGWRGGASQKYQAKLPDTSRFPSHRSGPSAAGHTRSTATQGMQNKRLAPPNTYLPTHANLMANQHPRSYRMNPFVSSEYMQSATATAAATYKQQKTPSTPTSSPPSQAMSTTRHGKSLRSKQPPISYASYTAPAQLSDQTQAREMSNGSAVAPTEAANDSILKKPNEADLSNVQIQNGSTAAPSSANHASLSKKSQTHTPLTGLTQPHNGLEINTGSEPQSTPASSSVSTSEELNRAQYAAWRAALNLNGEHQNSSIGGHRASKTPVDPITHANNHLPHPRSSDLLAQPAYNNPAAYPPGTFQHSSPRHHDPPITSPRQTYYKHFLGSDEDESVAKPVEVEKVRPKHSKHSKQHQKNGGGQKSGPVGRGKNHFDLIVLDG